MRCYVKGRIKTGSDTIAIDYIEAKKDGKLFVLDWDETCLLYTSPSPRDRTRSRMPSSA